MTKQFEIGGKPVSDSGLYPWSLGSISRALFFYGESSFLVSEKTATLAITTYYSLFHLSIFMVYQCPHLLDDNKREEINKRLKQGVKDPRNEISHDNVLTFLEKCSFLGLPKYYIDTYRQAREFREFMNYGPNIRVDSGNKIIDSCNFSFRKENQIASQLNSLFETAILWSVKNSYDSGLWVPIALDQSKYFFDNNGFYSSWSTRANLAQSEMLREYLHKLSVTTLNKNKK